MVSQKSAVDIVTVINRLGITHMERILVTNYKSMTAQFSLTIVIYNVPGRQKMCVT